MTHKPALEQPTVEELNAEVKRAIEFANFGMGMNLPTDDVTVNTLRASLHGGDYVLARRPDDTAIDENDEFMSIEGFIRFESFRVGSYPGGADDLVVHAEHLRMVAPEIRRATRNAVLDEVEQHIGLAFDEALAERAPADVQGVQRERRRILSIIEKMRRG